MPPLDKKTSDQNTSMMHDGIHFQNMKNLYTNYRVIESDQKLWRQDQIIFQWKSYGPDSLILSKKY